MARPTKQGIDYFPIDVQFDDKTELFIAEAGAEGLGVLVTVWQIIYQNEGYYTDYSDDLFLLIRKRVLIDVDKSKKLVDKMIERKIFSPEKFKDYGIITSNAIQKRYAIASKKKKNININPKYVINGVFDSGNITYIGINAGGNATNVNVNVNVKEKENSKIISSGNNNKPLDYFEAIFNQNLPDKHLAAWKLWVDKCAEENKPLVKTNATIQLKGLREISTELDVSEVILNTIKARHNGFDFVIEKMKKEKDGSKNIGQSGRGNRKAVGEGFNPNSDTDYTYKTFKPD